MSKGVKQLIDGIQKENKKIVDGLKKEITQLKKDKTNNINNGGIVDRESKILYPTTQS